MVSDLGDRVLVACCVCGIVVVVELCAQCLNLSWGRKSLRALVLSQLVSSASFHWI